MLIIIKQILAKLVLEQLRRCRIKIIYLFAQMTYYEKYTEKEFIGRGNYGKVYLVYEKQSLHFYVAKKISLEGLKFEEVDRTMREIEIHRHLSHPNIIAFRQYFLEDNDLLIIVMEYCEYGDLSVYIRNRQDKQELFEEPLIMNLFIQLVLGLQYLHAKKIVHRDIKPQNIFINEQGVLKLADFGISKALEQTQEKAMTLVGTPYYLSPEACKNEGYTTKSDIWALGCVLFELATLKHAFEGNNVLSLANKITHNEVPSIPNHYSAQLFQLIKMLLQKDPTDRPTTRQILQNQYVYKHSSNFSELQPYVQHEAKQKKDQKSYENEFMPNFEQQYQNQFLEDQNFHPRNTAKRNTVKTEMLATGFSSQSVEEQMLSAQKSTSQKLRDKCRKKMGEKLFDQIYGLMRSLKEEGFPEIEIEERVREQFGRGQFDRAMDVAQLIYIEDNH